MKRTAIAALLGLAACKPGPAPKLAGDAVLIGNTAPACQARQLGQVLAESTAVDATDTDVYWLDYNFGTLQRRTRGDGPVETLARWPDEHDADSMRVANGFVYWTSKAQGAVYRLDAVGGAPEAILYTDQTLGHVEVVGDTVYADTFDGTLLWWRSAGEHGELALGGDVAPVLAATADTLYIGGQRGIVKLASPGAGLQDVLATKGPIDALAASADSLYWVEAGNLNRRVAGGAPEQFAASMDVPLLVAAGDGVYLAVSNVVYFVADTSTEPVPVAIADAEISDLVLRRNSIFVGTTQGSAEELCPDPTKAVELADPDPTCTDCEWYGSGALMRRYSLDELGDQVEETFYADGTPMSVFSKDGAQHFYVTGEPVNPSD